MPNQPNILFLMTDQMQGRVLEPEHPCQTPNFDRLAARGLRIRHAYTPNPVCSPARASLMTGRLPHSHGVLWVDHCVDEDQGVLRTDLPHWAQRLSEAGYQTGYFGKWHVERSNDLGSFGWQVDGGQQGSLWQEHAEAVQSGLAAPRVSLRRTLTTPGYDDSVMYEVNDRPPEHRMLGITTDLALDFLRETEHRAEPWCCFVSCIEPHDPYVCGEDAFGKYDVDSLDLPPSAHDDLASRPGLYRKAARVFADLSDRERREAMACYYGMISEIDAQYGRLLEFLDASGQQDQTLVVLASDHGDFLGAHGLYLKNISAFEEAYEIPMVLAGPGVAHGTVSNARVGLHDLCPTLCEVGAVPAIGAPESRSFRTLLREPARHVDEFDSGYAEYSGTRYLLTQRVIWDGDWKLVWNGFDFDELYNLADDPYELRNLIDEPAQGEHVRRLMTRAWGIVRDSGDRALYRSGNWVLRLAPIGPRVLDT